MSNIEQTQATVPGILVSLVLLCFIRERANRSQQAAYDPEIQMNDCAILVVEDIPAIQTLVKQYLEGAGFRVITAEMGYRVWRPTRAIVPSSNWCSRM